MDDGNSIIRLKSKDERVFEITEDEGSISELIRDATEGNEEEALEIEIGRVNSNCLEKVVNFMKHYAVEKMKEIPTPLGGSTFNEVRIFCGYSGWQICHRIPSLMNDVVHLALFAIFF